MQVVVVVVVVVVVLVVVIVVNSSIGVSCSDGNASVYLLSRKKRTTQSKQDVFTHKQSLANRNEGKTL